MAAVTLQHAHINDADAFSKIISEPIDFSTSGDNVIISGIAAKRIYVFSLKWVVAGDTVLTVKNGPSTSLTGPMTYFAGGSDVFDARNFPWFQTSFGNDFILGSTNMVQVAGVVYYQQY